MWVVEVLGWFPGSLRTVGSVWCACIHVLACGMGMVPAGHAVLMIYSPAAYESNFASQASPATNIPRPGSAGGSRAQPPMHRRVASTAHLQSVMPRTKVYYSHKDRVKVGRAQGGWYCCSWEQTTGTEIVLTRMQRVHARSCNYGLAWPANTYNTLTHMLTQVSPGVVRCVHGPHAHANCFFSQKNWISFVLPVPSLPRSRMCGWSP